MKNMKVVLALTAALVGLWLVQPLNAWTQDEAKAPPAAKAADTPPSHPTADPAIEAPASQAPVLEGTAPAPEAAERGYLGAVVDDREDRGRGVRIERVIPGGPAEKAGLRKGDLITDLGGIRIRQIADFAGILEQRAPGSRLTFEVLRADKRERMDVVFGSRSGKLPAGTMEDLRAPLDLRPSGGLITPTTPQPPKPQPPKDLAPASKAAQPAGDGRAQIEALQRRVEQLERRVEQLERIVSRQFAQ